jgi:hypothetical protein
MVGNANSGPGKGFVGNPTGKGNLDGKNRNKNLPWKRAINRALSKKGQCEKAEELYLIAREVVECAQDRTDPNFKFAVQEVGQRLDGKAVETVELGTDTQRTLGVSAALGLLAEFTRREEAVVGEVIVPDRPLLSSEVCASEGGHGEGVDLPEVSGGSGQS